VIQVIVALVGVMSEADILEIVGAIVSGGGVGSPSPAQAASNATNITVIARRATFLTVTFQLLD
jgi:hypothetical protein